MCVQPCAGKSSGHERMRDGLPGTGQEGSTSCGHQPATSCPVHVTLPPSSPMTCRTGRWRPGFHKNTARSLFCVLFALFFFSRALRWRTCRNRALSVQTWNHGKHTQTSACASLQRHLAARPHLRRRAARFTGALHARVHGALLVPLSC